MRRVFAIAQNTFREAVRQKLLYGIIFFTVILIGTAYFLGQVSVLDAAPKMVKDMGLASIFIMGVFISFSMGISLVFKEIDRKTIYTILSKPVSRFEFILGKYFGLMFTVGIELFLMASLLLLLLNVYPEPVDWNLWKAIILIYAELCILLSITLVFSSYSSSFMTTLFCVSFLIVGHLTGDLAHIFDGNVKVLNKHHVLNPISNTSYVVFQHAMEFFDLDYFAINAKIVHGVPVSWTYVGYGLLYASGFIFFFLLIANRFFSKKDLK